MVEKAILAEAYRPFVQKWGEVGQAWGLGRSAAQIHALLLVYDRPLSADEIASALAIARSNVSASVKELKVAGLVESSRAIGDRKERLAPLDSGLATLGRLAAYRKAREIDPALAALAAAPSKGPASARLGELEATLLAVDKWVEALSSLSPAEAEAVLAAGPVAPAAKKKKKKK